MGMAMVLRRVQDEALQRVDRRRSGRMDQGKQIKQVTPQQRYMHNVHKYEKYFRKYALKLTRDKEKADELYQDTCLNAFRFISSFQDGSNAMAWITQIMKNKHINNYTKEWKQPEMVDYDQLYVGFLPVRHQEKAVEKCLSDEMVSALSKLDASRRTIFTLYAEDFSYEEIATIMDLPIGTVRSKIRRAKEIMREELNYYHYL